MSMSTGAHKAEDENGSQGTYAEDERDSSPKSTGVGIVSYVTCQASIEMFNGRAVTYCMRVKGHTGPHSIHRDSPEQLKAMSMLE